MARHSIREMKRTAAAGSRPGTEGATLVLARDAALSLLARSISFGHGRLAVIRLAMAVRAGAEVPDPHWRYCREVAETCRDHGVRSLFFSATQNAAEPARPH